MPPREFEPLTMSPNPRNCADRHLSLTCSRFLSHRVFSAGDCFQIRYDCGAHRPDKSTAPETESQIQTLLWMNLDKILDQVPPGTTITSNQFAKDFGPEAAEQLEKAGVTSIDNTAKPGQKSHFVIDFNQPGAVQTNSGELDHANSVSLTTPSHRLER